MQADETIRVFVGVDRTQILALRVLEHSIKRHTTANVQITPMLDLPIALPKDPNNFPRTGFSFTRFCIPELAGYQGKAIYMDADMQVFKDIRGLWNMPFDGAHIILQDEQDAMHRPNGERERKRQSSVMLLDCNQLKWQINDIINDLDAGKYGYRDLMNQLCIVDNDKIAHRLPLKWNHLDAYDQDTSLTHYTEMQLQPWLSTKHPLVELWFSEIRLMLDEGVLTWQEIEDDIKAGYLRPSLIRDIKHGHQLPKPARTIFNWVNRKLDRMSGFRPHQVFYRLLKESREKGAEQRGVLVVK